MDSVFAIKAAIDGVVDAVVLELDRLLAQPAGAGLLEGELRELDCSHVLLPQMTRHNALAPHFGVFCFASFEVLQDVRCRRQMRQCRPGERILGRTGHLRQVFL